VAHAPLTGRNRTEALDKADQWLKVVTDRRPTLARAVLAQAQVDEMQGRRERALANYKRAVMLGEQRPHILQQIVVKLVAQKEFAAADEMMRNLEARSPKLLAGLEQAGAWVALYRGNKDNAFRLAQDATKDSKDYRDHFWLGSFYRRTNMPKEAEQSFRSALALNDQYSDTWRELVGTLVGAGEKKEAESVVAQADKKLDNGKGKDLLVLGQCHELIGNLDRAGSLYEKAASTAQPAETAAVLFQLARLRLRTNQPDKTKDLLHKILSLNTTSAEQAASARGVLALLTAQEGGNQKAEEALALLRVSRDGVATAGQVGTDADLRARVLILATQASVPKRRQAIDLLVKLSVAKPSDMFMLARLYESVGEWTKARNKMTLLLGADQKELAGAFLESEKRALQAAYIEHLGYFCLRLLHHGDLAEAKAWQATLERLDGGSPRSLEVKARLMQKEGKADQAVAMLENLAEKNQTVVRSVAALLDQIGQVPAAEKMFKRYVDQAKEPEAVLALAAFFGRHERLDEALAVCEAAWKTCSPTAVSGVSVAILYGAKSGKAQAARVAGWIESAMANHPDNIQLMGNLCAVRRLQGRDQDAVELLRRIHARDKTDPLTLNNLAWLLTLSGKADEALDLIQGAVKLHGEPAWLVDTRAVVYLVKKQYNLAAKDMEDAIADSPTAHRYFHLAQAYAGDSKRDLALNAWQRAKGLGLEESTVDPLERDAFRQLRAQLDGR
jgi:cellulose synthase operon protein C